MPVRAYEAAASSTTLLGRRRTSLLADAVRGGFRASTRQQPAAPLSGCAPLSPRKKKNVIAGRAEQRPTPSEEAPCQYKAAASSTTLLGRRRTSIKKASVPVRGCSSNSLGGRRRGRFRDSTTVRGSRSKRSEAAGLPDDLEEKGPNEGGSRASKDFGGEVTWRADLWVRG